jgi:outer membrane receptor protein involved in Fe transport
MNNFSRPTKTLVFFLTCLIIACFFTGGKVFAQISLATVQGTVTDEGGEALPGAGIVVRNVETGYTYSSVTRSDGTYIISGILPGRYEMEVSLSGFATELRKGMTFAVAGSLNINFVLKPAAVEEEVTVTAEAPMVEMTKSDISSVIDREKIEDLPLLNRDFSDLTVLQAGVLDGRSNALQAGENEMIIDGISNEDVIQNTEGAYLPADAIQEFRIMTSNATAEYGNAAGMIRTAITRSGTNEFQGRLNYFYRDETLETPNYFVNHAEYKGPELPKDEWQKAPYSRHNFGGFLGGPIVKDKAHFFLVYEGIQQKAYATVTSPLVERGTVEQPSSVNTFFGKLNYQINQKNLLSLRFSTSPSKDENPLVGGLYTKDRMSTNKAKGFQIVGNWTFYPSNTSMNEVRVLIQNSSYSNLPADPNAYSINRPSGYFGKDENIPQEGYANKYQLVENFSLFLKNHSIKAGLEYIYAPNGATRMELYYPGQYNFYTDAPFNPANPGTYPTTLVYNSIGRPIAMDIPYTFFTPFIQDSWRVNSRLTLNLGLRYNYYDLTGIEMQNGSIKHLNPRFGFSWDPVGDGRTVIRGGVGTFTANLNTNPAAPIIFWDQFQLKVKLFPGYPDPSVPNPFVGIIFPDIPEFAAFDTEYETGTAIAPWTLQTTIGVQREILTDLSVSADIVYAKGYDAIRQKYLNPIIPGTLVDRPDPTRGQVITIESAGKSEYKGLFLNLVKRYSNGWALTASYTLSKAMGDTEKSGSEAAPWTNDADCWERAYGRMRNDARHKFTAAGTLDLPWGFQASGIFYYRSAYPWNAVYAGDPNLDAIENDYVDYHRNSRQGFDDMWLNVRLSKYFNFSNLRLQLFAEAYNLTNRTNFGSPMNVFDTSLFGQPVSAGDPRLIQLGIRFDWR